MMAVGAILAAAAALPAVIDLSKWLVQKSGEGSMSDEELSAFDDYIAKARGQAVEQGIDPAAVDQLVDQQLQETEEEGFPIGSLALLAASAIPGVGALRGGMGAARQAMQGAKGLSKFAKGYKSLARTAFRGVPKVAHIGDEISDMPAGFRMDLGR